MIGLSSILAYGGENKNRIRVKGFVLINSYVNRGNQKCEGDSY